MPEKKHKHLTLDDRVTIHYGIQAGQKLKEIAKQIRKDPTTISKEVKRNRHCVRPEEPGRFACIKKKACRLQGVCGDKRCSGLCKTCPDHSCYRSCSSYAPYHCKRIERFPYVCGDCNRRTNCGCAKYSYSANLAQARYEETLRESREGIEFTPAAFKVMDDLLSPLIKQGQPIHHAYEAKKTQIPCSQRSVYRYVREGYFTAKPLDLPRMVKFKQRRKRKRPKLVRQTRIGRSYQDFLMFCEEHKQISIVEMDTVKGNRKKGKVLLTFFFRQSSLLLAYLLESASLDAVCQLFDQLEEKLGAERFSELFPIILTDNGSEFADAECLETGLDGQRRTHVFYCDPMACWQKGQLEKSHMFLRYFSPKGKSMDALTPEKVASMVSHINSTFRKGLGNETPYQKAKKRYKKEVLELLDIKEVPADEVSLKPSLL